MRERRRLWAGFHSARRYANGTYARLDGPRGKRFAEGLCEVCHDRAQIFAPMRERQGEFMGQRYGDSKDSIRKLREIARGESPIFQQIEQKRVYVRAGGFHRIERKRIAIPLVRVPDAQGRIETRREHCEARFRFKKGVCIVEQCINRIGCCATSAGQD
jgi:hypothetical protein